jgi:maltooligosyltrehalose trehalohydrolase
MARRLPVGAEPQPAGGVHFRVWAPKRREVAVLIDGKAHALASEAGGYFTGLVHAAQAGTLYRLRLDGGDDFPDPASRFQPDGPHGASRVVDPCAFRWSDRDWMGVAPKGRVIYEMHVGTFTPQGTWEAAARELDELAAAGISVLELMPVADFAGEFGWGYDGVNLFAPTRLYGEPDDFRRFVDRAHAAGVAVILDVVYNHLGPDGNYLEAFAAEYFSDRYDNEWGEALNFDGDGAAGTREYFVANARYWIDEFHLDGLRLDATQQIFDASETNVMAEVTRAVREAAGKRATFVVAENEPQHARLARPVEEGGYGMDALWNDDLHHAAHVALTGHREAYYSDYLGSAQEFVSAAKRGFLYQGQRYSWQGKPRGSPTRGLPPQAFVNFLENHDQVANSAHGRRLHQLAAPGRLRALTAYLLLSPGTPMLFQGQEFASSAPFLFFADHRPELAAAVRRGRAEFLAQFPSLPGPGVQSQLDDPADPATFRRCKLDFAERARNAHAYDLHRDLLRLRREDPVFSSPGAGTVDGAVLGPEAFVLRYFAAAGEDRLLVVNLGAELELVHAPEPLLAPPEGRQWKLAWSSEDPRYGGEGIALFRTRGRWRIPGGAALALVPEDVA